MKTKDEKLLEMLYESIVNPKQLLEEEEKFTSNLARNIVDSLYKNILNIKEIVGGPLNDFVYAYFLNDLHYGNAFNASKEETKAIGFVFQSNLSIMYHHLVRVKVDENKPQSVCFRRMEDWVNKVTKEIRVSYENKEEIIKQMKNIMEDQILYMYDQSNQFYAQYLNLNENFVRWFEWRKDRLKLQGLTQKLPELKGVF